MRKTELIYGLLFVLSIHFGGLILGSIFENVVYLFSGYELLPWSRLLFVCLELGFLNSLIYKSEFINVSNKQVLQALVLFILLFIGAQFREELEPAYLVCGNSLLEEGGMEEYEKVIIKHSDQTFIVNIIETVIYILAIVFFTFRALKK